MLCCEFEKSKKASQQSQKSEYSCFHSFYEELNFMCNISRVLLNHVIISLIDVMSWPLHLYNKVETNVTLNNNVSG